MDSNSLITLMIGFGLVAVLGLVVGWAMWESSKSNAAGNRHEPSVRSPYYVIDPAVAASAAPVRTTTGTFRTVSGGVATAPPLAPTMTYVDNPYVQAAPPAPAPVAAPATEVATEYVPVPEFIPVAEMVAEPAPAAAPAAPAPAAAPTSSEGYPAYVAASAPAYAVSPAPAKVPAAPSSYASVPAPTLGRTATATAPARPTAPAMAPPTPGYVPQYTSTPRAPQSTVFRLGRVLWVDDHPDSHVPDVVALHRMGLTVTVATHCDAALAYLGAEKYLLVITDCVREGDRMSTAEFVHTVRRMYPGLPTVAYDPGAVVTGPNAPELPHDEVVTDAGALPSVVGRLLGR